MKTAIPHLTLIMAFGLIVSGVNTRFMYADDAPGHQQSGEHDHDMMKEEKKISEALATLSPEERKQAEAQRFCPIMEHSRLGATGTPLKVMIEEKAVFVCCKGCVEDAIAGGQETLKRVQELKAVSANLAKLPANERAGAEAQ